MNNPQLATLVPPGAQISDLVMPTEKVYYASGRYGGWQEHDLFPTTDLGKEKYKNFILNCKGQKFSLYLPIMVKGNTIPYNFDFIITDVQQLTK